MEVPREQPRSGPSGGEQGARIAVLVFMVLSLATLAFGVGWVLNGMSEKEPSTTPATTAANVQPSGDEFGAALLDEIYETLKNQYVDKELITPEKLRTAAIDGIIASLNDPHSSYISPQDVQAGALELNSSYEGIGASVSDSTGEVQIVAPFRESPAEAAGIRSGDTILEVDGESTDGWSDQQAVQRIRGPKGTTVALTVRHLDGTVETIEVVRGDIPITSVYTEPNLEAIPGESGTEIVARDGSPAPDIAYIAISQFHDATVSELRTALQGVNDGNYTGLILDLRGNPGGLLTATVDVADEFLDSGVILTEVDADGQKKSYSARPGGLGTEIPIVILQDAGSASGSEVLAGALRDDGRAKIVGTRSFGKGTVNLPVTLRDCGEPSCGILYISIGRWLSPGGEEIEGIGVRPDIEVPMTADEYIEQGDLQLFKAIEVLRGE